MGMVKMSVGGCEVIQNNQPDPKNFKIIQCWENFFGVLAEVIYPNCTNFEGRKLLLFKDITAKQLKEQKIIDPHFMDTRSYFNPIARFIPDDEGIKLGKFMLTQLGNL